MAVTTYNVRTLAVKGKNGYGHADGVLAKARQHGCDFIGLQERGDRGSKSFLLQGTGSSALGRKKRKEGNDCTQLG